MYSFTVPFSWLKNMMPWGFCHSALMALSRGQLRVNVLPFIKVTLSHAPRQAGQERKQHSLVTPTHHCMHAEGRCIHSYTPSARCTRIRQNPPLHLERCNCICNWFKMLNGGRGGGLCGPGVWLWVRVLWCKFECEGGRWFDAGKLI